VNPVTDREDPPTILAVVDEEARAYLQSRLMLLYKVMFWCFAVLMGFLWLTYRAHPEIEPANNHLVFITFASGLAIMAATWRGVLVRRQMSYEALRAIDTFYTVASSACIAFCAVASADRRQAVYSCMIYSCFAIFARTLIVPSTRTRTAWVTALATVPMALAAVLVAFVEWPAGKDVRAPGFFIGFAQIEVVVVMLAATGSGIIYGLRRQVTAAQQLGQYVLVKKIGEGGMGAVYLSRHLMLRRPTAVKLLLPERVGRESLERFEREVVRTSQLTHPNTVAVYDYGRSPDGVFYYAMEYLGGGIDLDRLVRTHGAQPAERVRQIVIQICGSLAEAHERGLIHRDIKPANIILCERGAVPDVVKVVDFGLVKEITADAGTSTQVVLGTPAYLAPEAVTDPSAIDARSDLYAVGCVGYFLLTGRPVFEGKTSVDLCIQHVTRPPPSPPELGALAGLVAACLAKTPGARPASAAALARALHDLGPLGDWDDARAAGWWRERDVRGEVAAEATALSTVTVDIGARVVAP